MINFDAKGFIAVSKSVHLLKSLKFDAIFVDEGHHPLPARMPKYEELYRFSATHTDEPDFRYPMGQAIDDGVLCDYDITVPAVTQHHAYVCLADLLLKQAGRFRRVLAYCNSIAEAKKFKMVIEELGLAAWHINATTPRKRRMAAIEEFSADLTKPVHVMVTVEVLGEGINIPNADTCVFVEPRNSYRSVIQAIGRVLRHHPGKTLAHIVLPAVAVPEKLDAGEASVNDPDVSPAKCLEGQKNLHQDWTEPRASPVTNVERRQRQCEDARASKTVTESTPAPAKMQQQKPPTEIVARARGELVPSKAMCNASLRKFTPLIPGSRHFKAWRNLLQPMEEASSEKILGNWLPNQGIQLSRAQLTPNKLQCLWNSSSLLLQEPVEGWLSKDPDCSFKKRCLQLKQYTQANGKLPSSTVNTSYGDLARWVTSQRNAGTMNNPLRRLMLESVHPLVAELLAKWDARRVRLDTSNWEAWLQRQVNFVKAKGRLPTSYANEGERPLYLWLWRQLRRIELLPEEIIDRLRKSHPLIAAAVDAKKSVAREAFSEVP